MCEQGTVKDLTVVDPTGTGEAPVNREEGLCPKIVELANEIRNADNPEELLSLVSALFEICVRE